MMSEEHEPDDDSPTESGLSHRRTVLVDGFNVLHAVLLGEDRSAGWWRREFRERLLDRVGSWNGGPDEIWVAFDGARPATSVWAEPVATTLGELSSPPPGPTIHSVFVESADDWIVRRARRAEHPEQLIVVSADRKVAGRARSAGCEILTPWAFIGLCPQEGPQEGPQKGPQKGPQEGIQEDPEEGTQDDRPDGSGEPHSDTLAATCSSDDRSSGPSLVCEDAPTTDRTSPQPRTVRPDSSCAVA